VVGGLSGAVTGELQPEEEVFKYRYAFTQLIRNGITTAMPITSMYYRQWAETYDESAAVWQANWACAPISALAT
jgi:hypothetical protein